MPMMPMMRNFPPFFWVLPFIFLAFILVFVLVVLPHIKRILQDHKGQSPFAGSGRNKSAGAKQSTDPEVPEELRAKAKQMMEEIDWEIRLLEGQLETEKDKEERKKLQREIEEKQREYRTIVDRFGW